MLNINFKVDDNILARVIISKSKMPTEFANYLWDKYNSSYIKIQRHLLAADIDSNIIKEVQQQSFFQNFLKQANENLIRIKQNWIQKEKIINEFLLKIIKTDFSLNTTCNIVSPELNTGHNIGNNSFVWGHIKGLEDTNYDLVYLVHESLHSYFESDNLSHSIIEEIADVELCKLLNHTYLGYDYHNFTVENHVKLFPFWNLYLNRNIRMIGIEQKYRNIKYDVNIFEKFRNDISKMNINQFLNFVKREIKMIKFETTYTIV